VRARRREAIDDRGGIARPHHGQVLVICEKSPAGRVRILRAASDRSNKSGPRIIFWKPVPLGRYASKSQTGSTRTRRTGGWVGADRFLVLPCDCFPRRPQMRPRSAVSYQGVQDEALPYANVSVAATLWSDHKSEGFLRHRRFPPGRTRFSWLRRISNGDALDHLADAVDLTLTVELTQRAVQLRRWRSAQAPWT
jgi:hypothetical protein